MNAFDETFLDTMDKRSEPPTAPVAERAGPWLTVEAAPDRFEVRRLGEAPEAKPAAFFHSEELALLAAAVFSATGRPAALRLADEESEEGFQVLGTGGKEGREAVGWLESFDDEVVSGLEVLVGLVSDPRALAMVLEASGATALRLAGVHLAGRVPRSQSS